MKCFNFWRAAAVLAGFGATLSTQQAEAIAFLHSGANGNPEDPFTSDTNFNAARPADDKGVPWDSVGFYNGGGGGTAISDRWFVSATHVGNGGVFTLPDNNPLSNDNYNVIQDYQVPGTDISFHKVDRALPSFTKLYTANPLTDLAVGNTQLLLIGDGFERAAPTFINTPGGPVVLGWNYGGARAKRWALNNVDAVTDQFDPGDAWWISSFKENTFGQSEGQVTPGDSGGGAFVRQGGEWRLLGPISYALTFPSPIPWAFIDRIYNTQNGPQELGSASAGYFPGLYLNSILANTDIPDPRTEAVPEAATFYAAAGLALGVWIRSRSKTSQSDSEAA